MDYQTIEWPNLETRVQLSYFTSENTTEIHAVLTFLNCHAKVEEQFEAISRSINCLVNEELKEMTLVWKRYFLSDAVNQSIFINEPEFSFSLVQQPPLNGTKVIVWLYFVSKVEVIRKNDGIVISRPNYTHFFHFQLHKGDGNIQEQTHYALHTYSQELFNLGCSLREHCLRTWIYIQGVDIHYKEMALVRAKYFESEGLNKNTHYIASTGIEGSYTNTSVLFLMDAYAVKGLKSKQIRYLKAYSHLSPTLTYGVTFERGTSVDYGDRRHIFISGTASIDKMGEIVNPGSVTLQLHRTLENIKVLLAEADAKMDDLAQAILYLRDPADYNVIEEYMEQNFPQIPKAIVYASVCRPGWLIEVECIAIKKIESEFCNF